MFIANDRFSIDSHSSSLHILQPGPEKTKYMPGWPPEYQPNHPQPAHHQPANHLWSQAKCRQWLFFGNYKSRNIWDILDTAEQAAYTTVKLLQLRNKYWIVGLTQITQKIEADQIQKEVFADGGRWKCALLWSLSRII